MTHQTAPYDQRDERLDRLADAGVPSTSIAREFGLTGREAKQYQRDRRSPHKQVEQLANAWSIVTDEGRTKPGYSQEELLAGIVTRSVFAPIIRATISETQLEPYLRAALAPSTVDGRINPTGVISKLYRVPPLGYAAQIGARSIEEERADDDTSRTLMDKASKRIYTLLPTGAFVLTPEQAGIVTETLDTLLETGVPERAASIFVMANGFGTERKTFEEIGELYGIPAEKALSNERRVRATIINRLAHNPD